ncbi:hypothetical protein EVAR_11494_1 [Eumeta japonica]|uniref:Uncharacterized protein n=1 Tax=Eumeta variegata TaxID=151549 RepID=A0A4C1TYN2_EUMVA|nr:hypothetical protein EVAR_11494_1 [Eumeta japonica]
MFELEELLPFLKMRTPQKKLSGRAPASRAGLRRRGRGARGPPARDARTARTPLKYRRGRASRDCGRIELYALLGFIFDHRKLVEDAVRRCEIVCSCRAARRSSRPCVITRLAASTGAIVEAQEDAPMDTCNPKGVTRALSAFCVAIGYLMKEGMG